MPRAPKPVLPDVRTSDHLAEGEVRIQNRGTGWFLVELGRGRYIKRFNMNEAELRQVAAYCQESLPGV